VPEVDHALSLLVKLSSLWLLVWFGRYC